jgi:hypothetical protein
MILQFKKLFVLIFVLVLCACAAIIPKEHLIPNDQLTSTMEKHFPLLREKGLIKVTIDEPELKLKPNQNRLGMNGHFTAHASVLEVEGNFTLSGRLQYNPKQRAVYLQDASLDSLHLKQGISIPEMLRTEINRMLNEYAANNPVYRFKPDELVVLGVKVEVWDIEIVAEGVLLKLRPMH